VVGVGAGRLAGGGSPRRPPTTLDVDPDTSRPGRDVLGDDVCGAGAGDPRVRESERTVGCHRAAGGRPPPRRIRLVGPGRGGPTPAGTPSGGSDAPHLRIPTRAGGGRARPGAGVAAVTYGAGPGPSLLGGGGGRSLRVGAGSVGAVVAGGQRSPPAGPGPAPRPGSGPCPAGRFPGRRHF